MATEDIHDDGNQWSMVVLYDPKSGAIVHSHQVVTHPGGVHPDAQALEKQALEHAGHAHKAPLQGMAVLHVNPRELDLEASYAVDVKAKRLKSIAKADRAGKHSP
jgi:hypothetical protein